MPPNADHNTLVKVSKKDHSLNLQPIKNDFVLPHKSIFIGHCYKKNQTMGSEKRYLLLGTS